MQYRHYAPKAPVTVVRGAPDAAAAYIEARLTPSAGVIVFDEWAARFEGYATQTLGSVEDDREQARRIFDALRAFDHIPVTEIWAMCPAGDGLGLAVSNRLSKAAGFHIVDGEEEP